MGIHPKRIGGIAADIVVDLAFQRHVRCLHRLGDRVLGEFLAEIGAERSIQTLMDMKLARYARLTPEQIKAAGGDGWPPSSIPGEQS